MHRFFTAPENISGKRIYIKGSEVNHLTRVLRLGPGDTIQVSDGTGKEYAVEIIHTDHRMVEGKILHTIAVQNEPPLEVTLFQGIPKGDKMEMIIQKCTELGVKRIIPLLTNRTIVHLDERKARERCERWQRIALEAAKQSGRAIVPEIGTVISLQDTVATLQGLDLILVPWEEETSKGLKSLLTGRQGVQRLACFIGPEGGFASEEVLLLRKAGGITVTLGPRILRTETAGLVTLSVIMYELGDLGGRR